MGSKFCNINIQGVPLEDIRTAAPEYQAFVCAPGWVTVVSPRFQWGRTQRYAKALSEAIPAPVLSTEYFDDDYVEFAVYREGQRIARHVPVTYEDLRRSCGRAAAFMTAFGLSLADTPLLKKLFALRNCEESVLLMESLLGCPIFGVDTDNPPTEAPDPGVVRAFAGGLPAIQASKAKNPTKKDQPPYLFNDAGDCKNPKEFYCRSVIYYTDDADKVIQDVRRMIGYIEQERYFVHEHSDYVMRVLKKGPITVVQNIIFGSTDACAGDFSKGLVAICSFSAGFTRGGSVVRNLDCALAYGKQLLCYGQRECMTPAGNAVMPGLTLESPWLNLQGGELVRAFETPNFWDAAHNLGELLGVSLYPMEGCGHQLVHRERSLEIYEEVTV